jgi:hypothetical protein
MKPVRIITLMVIIALAVLPVLGCKIEPQAELSPARLSCIEMMQQVPVYYEDFEFWDVGMLREDPDLGEMYDIWYERKIKFLEERYGVQSTSIDYLAQGEGLLDIIKADYNIAALRNRINLNFYRDTSHEDMEVWKSEPSRDPQSVTGGWVLTEGLLVRGANNSNVDDYLRVATGKELSMYDRNAAELLERLPEGVTVRISRSPYPESLVVSGMSIEKEANNTIKWTNVYKFESVEAAGRPEVDEYLQKIEEDFTKARDELTRRGESPPFHDFNMSSDGEFVQWSMSVETKYMIALLFYG